MRHAFCDLLTPVSSDSAEERATERSGGDGRNQPITSVVLTELVASSVTPTEAHRMLYRWGCMRCVGGISPPGGPEG